MNKSIKQASGSVGIHIEEALRHKDGYARSLYKRPGQFTDRTGGGVEAPNRMYGQVHFISFWVGVQIEQVTRW